MLERLRRIRRRLWLTRKEKQHIHDLHTIIERKNREILALESRIALLEIKRNARERSESMVQPTDQELREMAETIENNVGPSIFQHLRRPIPHRGLIGSPET